MPAKSKSQVRKLFALEARGQVKPGTAEEFVKATPGGYKALPQRVKPSALGMRHEVGLCGACLAAFDKSHPAS